MSVLYHPMKGLSQFIVPLLLCGSLWAETSPADEAILPESIYPQLNTILRQAVQQSPSMLNRALDLEIAENSRIEARANVLPNVGGYANYFQSRDTRADITGRLVVTKIAYNYSINQPLFYWGERRNNVQIGEIQASIARGQYRNGYRQFAQTLRGDYLRLIVQKLAVRRAAFYLDFAKNQLRFEEARLAKKEISDMQIFSVRLAADRAQIASERTQFDFEMAKISFARLSGGPVLNDDDIPDTIPVIAYDAPQFARLLAEYLDTKELPTTEAITLRKQLDTQNLNYANVKTRLRPKFNAVLGNSQDEQSFTLNTAQKYKVNSVFGGISLSWSIFDGFAQQAAERTALARRRQMETDYKSLNQQLRQQAQIQVKQINFCARDMAISDRALTDSQGGLKSRQEEFARGTVSEADVSLTRMSVYDAEINAYYSRIDFLNRVGEFLGTVVKDPVVANVAEK
jgi:outer membrane protein TolC